MNDVTGDYSPDTRHFWVENGQMAYPVHEITISGNMKDMRCGIEVVCADAYNCSAKIVA